MPKTFAPRTAMIASARVVLISAVPPRRNGMKDNPCSPSSTIPNPPSGSIPSQLFIRIKKKTEIAIGKIFTESARLPVT